MSKSFYGKLSFNNLKKNHSIYLPYLIASICTIASFYIMNAIALNEGLSKMPGASSIQMILQLGSIVIGIFAAIFLFYTNSFLIKRRKKELGLYSILGMEKKHVIRVLSIETIYTSLFSIGAGLIIGVILSKVLFLVLLNLLSFDVTIVFEISWEAIKHALFLFFAIFFVTLLSNLWQVKISNPIELLHGEKQGEKEPKTKWVLSLIGFLSLGIGYYIAITVESPLDALTVFFVAVILVIIGTFALFTAGSIAVLKLLRKNKKFYYKTNNFISISGMIYRMKQNAAGLSNICILSAMVLVTLSTTICLYVGREDSLNTQYPNEVMVEYRGEKEELKNIISVIEKLESKHSVKRVDDIYRRYEYGIGMIENNQLTLGRTESFDVNKALDAYAMLIDEYNEAEGKEETLEHGQVLLYDPYGKILDREISINGIVYGIKEKLEEFKLKFPKNQLGMKGVYIVFADIESINEFYKAMYQDSNLEMNCNYSFDLEGENEDILSFEKALEKELKGQYRVMARGIKREEFYSIYGGFLFLGIFLGLLFMMATVLIIYYKQISEGYDDHERFQIMQKVGLSKKEVKKIIKKQILMVFFLPLIGAVIHILFAFSVISKLLMMFGLLNTTLFAACTAFTVFVFAIGYGLVYHMTAKTYYKLVQM